MTSGIGGGNDAFEDADGDGVAELQEDHADFKGGEARNVGAIDVGKLLSALDAAGYDITGIGNLGATSADVNEITVGQTGPVTGIVGDSGEHELLASFDYYRDTSYLSTTSTSYDDVGAGARDVAFDYSKFDATGYSQLKVELICGVLRNDTSGETTYARIWDNEAGAQVLETSVTDTSFKVVSSGRTAYDPGAQDARFQLELKVTAGTGSAGAVGINIWGEIA